MRLAFSTLEGRPSAFDFDSSPVLQDWVTVTDIRISLRPTWSPAERRRTPRGGRSSSSSTDDSRLNSPPTVGTDVISGWHYALADLAVGARCKCNGHASRCIPDVSVSPAAAAGASGGVVPGRTNTGASTTGTHRYAEVCDCRHNTAGPDCERCKPFHYDRPWARATATEANECIGQYKQYQLFGSTGQC